MVLLEVNNAEFLKNLYPKGLILNDVVIDHLQFSYNGPSVEVSIISKQIPEVIPAKWNFSFNRIRFVFDVFDIEEINFTKWGRINICKIEISERPDSKKILRISGDDCKIELLTTGIYYKSISPFEAEL